MTDDTTRRLDAMFAEAPILRAEDAPSDAEIDRAEAEVGVPFPADYRLFLRRYGAAMVGPYPIFGLRPVEVMGVDSWSVVVMTRWYRDDGIPGADAWVVISHDHAGNPVGLDRSGAAWIHDHDFGGLAPLAPDFETYLRARCLKLP
jgi:hypothetical protein